MRACKNGIRKRRWSVRVAENLPVALHTSGDVVKTISGKTIEVLNTDAEGRVVLADAVNY